MPFRSLSGSRIIGQGTPQPVPIQLDPAPYKGALAFGTDNLVYVSDGTAWNAIGAGTQGTTGIQGDAGNQGVQGTYGPGFTIIGSVPDVNVDPPNDEQLTLNTAFPGANTGDGVIDNTDDELWIYDGATWVNFGSFRGVQGFQGVQGLQGFQGTIGEEGIQGSRGFRGFQGTQGIQGDTGLQGLQGIQGNQGTQGPQGTQGVQGFQGLQGDLGNQGTQGPQSIQGTTGIQGDVGIQGMPGDDAGMIVQYNVSHQFAEPSPATGGFMYFDSPAADTGNLTGVSKIWISDSDTFNIDLTAYFTAIDASSSTNKAVMKVTLRDNPSKYIIFNITELTDDGNYWDMDASYVSGTALKEDFVAENPGNPGTYISLPCIVAFSIAGDRGFQGVQGPQGTQGVQGVQGLQGDQGVQGVQGDQGVQGVQGSLGLQGELGFSGGLTFNFDYNSSTTEGFPGLNQWLLNDADVTQASKLYIDDLTNTGRRVDGLFNYLDTLTSNPKGQIFIRTPKNNGTDEYEFVIYNFSNWTWSPTGTGADWGHFDVSWVASSTLGGTDASPGTSWTSGAVPTYGVTAIVDFIPSGQRGMQGVQGMQGTTGIQGLLGNQGIQGDQGVQGFQGTQGFQGVQGDVGVQGIQGTTGIQGDTGFQGLQGHGGNHGGLTFEWNFDADLTAQSNPGASKWKINSGNITTATTLTIDDLPLDNFAEDIDGIFNYLQGNPSSIKGQIFIESQHDDNGPPGHHFVVYEFTDFTWDASGNSWGWFDINYVESSSVTANDWNTVVTDHGPKTVINFIPAGLTGTQGMQGTTGIQGDIGFQGIQGDQGVQGIQGVQGNQGAQGVAGAFGGASFEYDYTPDATPTGPAAGVLKFNNADISAATVLRINEVDANGNDIEAFLRTIDDSSSATKAYIKLISIADPTEFALYALTGSAEPGAYFNLNVTWISSSTNMDATYLTSNVDVIVTFARTGDSGIQGLQGMQGTLGIQGDLGIQGSDGAGSQGIQGVQGDLGFQGTQGFPGPIGPQGAQGTDGLQGGPGFQGSTGGFGGVTFDYTYSTTTTTTADPGVGYIRFNNAALASATEMAIDDRDDGFNNLAAFLQTIDDSTSPIKGHFKVSEKTDPNDFAIFTISGLVDEAGWFRVQCANITQSLTNFANDEDIIITFARTGDIGPDGPQGVQGFEGFQGPGGLQGGGGGQGTQGPQGMQGTQGFQGTPGFIGGDGTQGFQGFQGIQGFQGVGGVDGNEGGQGVQGIQGLLGEGAQGIQGESGAQGIAGIGATGIQGFQGIQGDAIQGMQGLQGDPGPPGAGNQGIQGLQGFQGTIGDPGFQGVQGIPGAGDAGVQGVQGIDGDPGVQGFQGIGGDGNQGVQGFQGAGGIGADGIQGNDGVQGTQGIIGESGVGGTQGVQGFDGIQGFQGTEGGLGELGAQGHQGTQGDFGFQGPTGAGSQGIQGGQGVQGNLGIQGFPGQGTQGIQGTQAAQGVQGERGFQGTQGAQGFGPEGAVNNIQNVHETSVQDTALFITMVEGGSTTQPLRATTGPNPGSESNFFYTSDVDELTVENIQTEGNLVVEGTATFNGSVEGFTSNLFFPTDVFLGFGGSAGVPTAELGYNGSSSSLVVDVNTAVMSAFRIRNTSTNASIFTMNTADGSFTATGNIEANSDENLKENIETINDALLKVNKLRGVYFDMKAHPGKRNTGVIAQEMERVLPEVVSTDPEDGIKSVAYGNVVGLLIEAIKELKEEVDQLKG